MKIKLSNILSEDSNPFVEGMHDFIDKKFFAITYGGHNGYWVEADDKVLHVWQDEESYTKIYSSDVMVGADKYALEMFLYIANNLHWNSQTIRLTPKKYRESTGVGTIRFTNCICELMRRGVIARADKESWYINPLIMFNGNRVNLLRDVEEVYDLPRCD